MEGAEEGNGLAAAADMVSLYSLYLRLKARRKYHKESIHFADGTLAGRKSRRAEAKKTHRSV
jgi:hypothetical protein